MLVADYKYLFIIPHARKKVVAGLDFGTEFGGRINRGIDFAAESLLCRFQGGNDIAEAYVAYYHQVHIAAASLFASSNGTVDKGHRDAASQGRHQATESRQDPLRACLLHASHSQISAKCRSTTLMLSAFAGKLATRLEKTLSRQNRNVLIPAK